MKKISVSFKDTEMYLYEYLKSKRSQSNFIKDLLAASIEIERKGKEQANYLNGLSKQFEAMSNEEFMSYAQSLVDKKESK